MSLSILKQAEARYDIKKFVGLFSGGKDSLVACHFLSSIGKLDSVLYCNTGINIRENFDYVLQTCEKFGWKLNILHPKQNESYEDFIRKFSFPRTEMHGAVMGYLKYHPLRKWAREHRADNIAYVSGRRRKESKRRAKILGSTTIERIEGMTFVAALYHWTDNDIWNYIKDNKLAICPVYQTMHLSGDCMCGAFASTGEAELLSVFHKETANKIRLLEDVYGGKWGLASSMKGAMKQQQLSEFLTDTICQECSNFRS